MEDRRVRKTRRQLRDALVALILEKGWDEVTVLEVCAKADVGRSTFYLHFADLEDLLLSGFDELHEQLGKAQGQVGRFGFVQPLLEHAHENTRLFRAVVGRKSGQAVQRRFRDVVTELLVGELTRAGVPAAVRAPGARYLSGALVELLLGWVESARGQGARELADFYLRLSDRVVEGLTRPLG